MVPRGRSCGRSARSWSAWRKQPPRHAAPQVLAAFRHHNSPSPPSSLLLVGQLRCKLGRDAQHCQAVERFVFLAPGSVSPPPGPGAKEKILSMQ